MRIFLLIVMVFVSACAQNKSEGVGIGYGGNIKVTVELADDKIKDVVLVSDNETSLLMKRAFPIMRDRIIAENTPVVDSVSGATFTSFGIKSAVAKALNILKRETPKITFNTVSALPTTPIQDIKTDILIIGGGPSGLAAAIEASKGGAEVTLIEKLDILSGNGKFDKDFNDMVDTEAEKKANIPTTKEELYAEFIARKTTDTPERLRAFVDGAAEIDKWMRSFGITLDYIYAKRSFMNTSNSYAGEHIQDNIEQVVKDLGVDIRTGTKGVDLIIENKIVKGATVQYKDQTYKIMADAVIIATGGFSANTELLKKYRTDLVGLYTSNQEQNKGDFIPVFEKHNMGLKNLGVYNIFPFTYPKTRALTGTDDPRGDFFLVNAQGNRFVNEKTARDEIAKAIQSQEGEKVYYIYDQSTKDICYRLRSHEDYGWVSTGQTLEELAGKLKIDSNNFANAFNIYNKAIAGEITDPMGRTPYSRQFTAKGPYYAIPVRSAFHMTRGGVTANEKAEVLYKDGTVVKGLYAAGEVTDFIVGAYMGSYVFGRIAGQQAAEFITIK